MSTPAADTDGSPYATKADLRHFQTVMELRFANLDQRIAGMETRMVNLPTLDARIAELESRLTIRFAGWLVAQTGVLAAIVFALLNWVHPQ